MGRRGARVAHAASYGAGPSSVDETGATLPGGRGRPGPLLCRGSRTTASPAREWGGSHGWEAARGGAGAGCDARGTVRVDGRARCLAVGWGCGVGGW